MSHSVYLADEAATVDFGKRLGALLSRGGVIYLEGTLGAGKTTLCRGILSAFGHCGAVKSPTYTLVEPYNFAGRSVYHFDLYRLGDPEELEFLGIRDYFLNGSICLIEWPNKGRGYIQPADLLLQLQPVGQGRKLDIEAGSEYGREMLCVLASNAT